MYPSIRHYCEQLISGFDRIPFERKKILEKITAYVQEKRSGREEAMLVYICTHNSRRSHFGQVWAQVAAAYYQIENTSSYSGGTEETAVHPNTVRAFQQVGFDLKVFGKGENPEYHLFFDDSNVPAICFSKTYDAKPNPTEKFIAIMTCSEAEENCPFVSGAEQRVSTTYEDPKLADDSDTEMEVYADRCKQIATETFYVFSKLK